MGDRKGKMPATRSHQPEGRLPRGGALNTRLEDLGAHQGLATPEAAASRRPDPKWREVVEGYK